MDTEPKKENAFPSIGSLLPPESRSRRNSALNPDELSKNSEIIGPVSLVPKDANSIGTQLSVTVSGRVQTVTDIRQLGDPEATDKALLASLPQSVRLSLREVREAEIDPRYGYDEVFKTFRLADALTPEARAAALRLVEAAMAPADKMTIAREVTRLRAMTKAKAEQEDDLKVLAALYSEDLRAYPTDVVVSVIRKWINREKWWPAWSELKAMLDEALRYRSALLKTLEEHHGA